VLNLNEDPYFSFIIKEVKSVEENSKTSDNNNDDLKIYDDVLLDEYDTDDSIPSLTNINNNDVQREGAKVDIVLPEKADSAEQIDDHSEEKEISSVNSNESDESNRHIQGILIAIQNFAPSAADLDAASSSSNDYNNIINDIKVDQTEQNLKMLSNELSTLSMRLVDIEKILIQSFQLDLMIILMFILMISLILFRVFFMEKRSKFILMGGRGRVSRVSSNVNECHEKCMNGFEKMQSKN